MVLTSSTFVMVKVPVYQVIHMIAVRNRLMPTSWSMGVVFAMAPALVIAFPCRILRVDCNHMLIDVIRMGMVQVSIMKVVCMSLVLDGGVPARGTMLVGMFFVNTT